MSREQYEVTVTFRQDREVKLKVWAEDEGAACEKAVEIVEGWDGTSDVEADDAEEM